MVFQCWDKYVSQQSVAQASADSPVRNHLLKRRGYLDACPNNIAWLLCQMFVVCSLAGFSAEASEVHDICAFQGHDSG